MPNRRRRKWQGSDWTPPSMSADKADGAWCPVCHKFHGYKSMKIGYDKTSTGTWKILWMCPKTLNVIKEQHL